MYLQTFAQIDYKFIKKIFTKKSINWFYIFHILLQIYRQFKNIYICTLFWNTGREVEFENIIYNINMLLI